MTSEVHVIGGGSFDIHTIGSKVLNKIGLSTTNIPSELHVPGYQFLGPNTSLTGEDGRKPRLNEDRSWKDFSTPINGLDQAAYIHDLEYYDIEKNNTDKDIILNLKHESDQKLLKAFDAFQPTNWRERLARFFVQNAIKLKLKFGMSLDDKDNNTIKNIVNELHHRYKKSERRMVIVPNINHTHSCDIFEYDKQKFVTYIDVFSKKACIFMINNKNADTTLKVLEGAFLFLGSPPRLLWTDDGKEFVNKKVQDYLTEKNVKWYSTFSELKACVIERFNLTIREKLEKKKTEHELSKKKFVLREVLPEILEEYNNTVHSTTKMTPNDAHKPENEMAVRRRYITKYKLKDKGVAKFEVGDRMRIYNYKYIFDKKSGKRFTDEIFKVKKVNDTKPVTYELEDLNGEEVKGCFYNNQLVAANEEL